MTVTIRRDIQTLDPGCRIEVFELDATALGGGLTYFHAGTNDVRDPIVWQGITYNPWPITASGYEYVGRGQLPTPRMRVANMASLMTQLNRDYDDLIGAKVTRRRTYARYLDGMPDADPTAVFPDDVFYVNRKVSETLLICEYELASLADVEGVMLPLRQVLANTCQWVYRSAECGYVGDPVADVNDVATSDADLDDCSLKVSGCKLRFGSAPSLPFGGYPGAQPY